VCHDPELHNGSEIWIPHSIVLFEGTPSYLHRIQSKKFLGHFMTALGIKNRDQLITGIDAAGKLLPKIYSNSFFFQHPLARFETATVGSRE
jgi:hypothetical protein